MRICFLADASSIHSYRWIKHFADQGHDVHWLSSTRMAFSLPRGTNFYLVPAFSGRRFRFSAIAQLSVIRRLILAICPDILHAHYAGVNGVMGALSGRRPFVLTAWGSDVLIAGRARIAGMLVRLALRRADLVTCDAYHMRDAIINLGVSGNNIQIVHFGTDVEQFGPRPRDENVRAALGLGDAPTVISLRNFEPIYDVETLIHAIPHVVSDIDRARFILAGTGSRERGLRALAEQLGVASHARFVGMIPNDRLPAYLACADAYVSTSLSDAGLAASTAEAMASELPVVVTNSGENSRWIDDGANGFVVPVSDPVVLADRIVRLLADVEMRRRFGKLGRTIILERNNFHVEMKRMEDLYHRVLEKTVAA